MSINLVLMLKAIVVAIIEGLTEFIPVSSTGHMIIAEHFLDFKGNFANTFTIVIQLGAILAILVLYWKKIWTSVVDFFMGKPAGVKFWVNIIIAFIPAAVLGFLFDDKIDELLFNPVTVACALVVGGVLMIMVENKYRKKAKTENIDSINIKQAFKIGCFQCLALWPGMSRSSSTIIGAWISGVSTIPATEFSFFLALPTMVGATGLKLYKNGFNLTNGELLTLGAGFIVAFLVALVVVDRFVSYLKKKPMKVFAVYRIVVGVLIIGLSMANIM